MSDTRLGIVELFGNRKKFIIIGLTGRTGSGCTTVAELLSKDWNDFKAPKSMADDSSINEARKYKIAFNFSEKNWKKFHVIQIRDVITSFIIENNFAASDVIAEVRNPFNGEVVTKAYRSDKKPKSSTPVS